MQAFSPDHKAGVLPRFLARLIDGLILFIPTLVLTVPVAGGFQIGSQNTTARSFVSGVLAVGLAFGYHVFCEAMFGRTPGKRALGLQVRSVEGRPTLGEASRRNAFILLSLVPTTVGGLLSLGAAIAIAVTIGTDPAGRGVHDRFAQLQVVDVD